MAWYHYQGHLDYENATLGFERVLRLSPGDADAQQGLAAVRRRQGRFEEALEGFYAVADADPRNQQNFDDIAWSLDLLGRHDEAHSTYRAALALDPSSVEVLGDVAYSRLLAGDLEGASTYVGRVSDPLSASTQIPYVSVFLERVGGRQQTLLLGLERVERPLLSDYQLRIRPVDLVAGDLLIDLGRPDAARQRFASAVRLLEEMRSADPEDPRVHAALGLVYASLGREDEALRSARAAVELMPMEREAVRGAAMLDELARTYTRIGDHDAALDTLERLFALQNSLVITPALARIDPDWAPLRRDPRFEVLLARVERGR
jgi:Flp pilus assembly protein TadD